MSSETTPRRTPRFRKRREAVLRTAVTILNRRGVYGMTLKDIAAQLGIVPTGVIYYFPNKESLAAACFLEAIEHYQHLIELAAEAPDPVSRVRRFVTEHFHWYQRVLDGETHPVAIFNDVRALNCPQINSAYEAMFRRLRRLLDPQDGERAAPLLRNARTHLLLSTVYWSTAWLDEYEAVDLPRTIERTLEVLLDGLVPAGQCWSAAAPAAPHSLPPAPSDEDDPEGLQQFLRAATEVINAQGYFGASIDKIAAHINLTKGAFYHRIAAKDDLVRTCFEQTLDLMEASQLGAREPDRSGLEQLSTSTRRLIEYQTAGSAPMLRVTALTAMPEDIQRQVMTGFNRITRRFAGMISDGIADGSVRPVDPNIAAQILTGHINAAAELSSWVRGINRENASDLYVRPLFRGLFHQQ